MTGAPSSTIILFSAAPMPSTLVQGATTTGSARLTPKAPRLATRLTPPVKELGAKRPARKAARAAAISPSDMASAAARPARRSRRPASGRARHRRCAPECSRRAHARHCARGTCRSAPASALTRQSSSEILVLCSARARSLSFARNASSASRRQSASRWTCGTHCAASISGCSLPDVARERRRRRPAGRMGFDRGADVGLDDPPVGAAARYLREVEARLARHAGGRAARPARVRRGRSPSASAAPRGADATPAPVRAWLISAFTAMSAAPAATRIRVRIPACGA